MKSKFLAAVAAGALMLGAGAANATTNVQKYDFSVYDAGFTGDLGSVTVTDHGTSTLDFDIVLGSNVYFQLTNGNPKNAFWFDLPGLVGNQAVTYNITSPNDPSTPGAGDYPTGGQFSGAGYSNNNYGQGWSSGYDYAMMVADPVGSKQYFGNGGHLTFSVTANNGQVLSLASLGNGQAENLGGKSYNVVMGADLRQCLSQVCVTGPVGAIINSGGAVPEPATWGLMILGFGGIGSVLRRRRNALAVA